MIFTGCHPSCLMRSGLRDEVGRVAVVGEDAAHPGGGQVDLVDGLTGEEVIDHRLVEEVQFGVAGWCAGS